MAGVLDVTATVDVSGPLSDGTAVADLGALMDSIAKAIADSAEESLKSVVMNKTGRSRGRFRANLHQVDRGPATIAIPGPMITGVTWAPWLEGVSRRNASTKFKGYHLFRNTARKLNDGKAQAIAEAKVAEYAALIGGA